MSNQIALMIAQACGQYPRDFTEEEKQYILDCGFSRQQDVKQFTIAEFLIYWFESTSSDGCWTKANCEFVAEIKENL